MSRSEYLEPTETAPPDFLAARNRRQKVRAAGLNPDYWYAVEWDANIKPGQVISVEFWKRPIAVYRGTDGKLRALEDRCAHRQLKLSTGEVQGCNLVCPYHGWTYDGSGRVCDVPHDLFGHAAPQVGVHAYPIQVRYGLVWVFPGDPALAETRRIPDIPELEGPADRRWGCIPIDFTIAGHHSMVIDNVSDFSHAWLHRKYKPFSDAKLTKCEADGDKVFVTYDTKVGHGKISGMFVDRRYVNTNSMDLCYEYPYQWSNTDNKIKHWLFVLPIDERTTRAFFLFYFERFRIPILPLKMPRRLMHLFLRFGKALHVKPLLAQDRAVIEAEQAGYERFHEAPIAELNPAVKLFQDLTIRKWNEQLAKTGQGKGALPVISAAAGVTG